MINVAMGLAQVMDLAAQHQNAVQKCMAQIVYYVQEEPVCRQHPPQAGSSFLFCWGIETRAFLFTTDVTNFYGSIPILRQIETR
jgi:hypothetical protein